MNDKQYPVNGKQYWSVGVSNLILFGLFAGLFYLIARANFSDTTRRGLEVAVVLVFGSLFYLFDEAEYMLALQEKHTHKNEPLSALGDKPDAGSIFDLYYRIDPPAENGHDADILKAPGERQEN